MNRPTEYTNKYTLTAGESNACGRMPLTLVTERIIEVATEHANALGIGYAALITRNIGWVLSRLSIEMTRYPIINEEYSFTTWIESYNRHFSERNFAIHDGSGAIIGYARTVWVAMDFASRTVADLTAFEREAFPTADLPCPIPKAPRISPLPPEAENESYTFRYCDIDFNRHVNTMRYIEMMLDMLPIERLTDGAPMRFDIHFMKECRYGQTLAVGAEFRDDGALFEIVSDEGAVAVRAAIEWK